MYVLRLLEQFSQQLYLQPTPTTAAGTLGGLRRLEEQGVGRRGERLATAGPAAQEVVLAPPETAAAAGSAAAVVFGDAADPQRGPRDRDHRGGSDVDVLEVQLRLQQDRRRQM